MSLQLIFKDETVQDHLHVLIRASFRFTGMSINPSLVGVLPNSINSVIDIFQSGTS